MIEDKPQDLTTGRKALTINLDPQIYGTFAEIGAGQEVVRWFFKVGGAAGTIAKSMSAYDMKFSDAIYGKSKRYVSLDRLRQMLEHEYDLLVERLKESRGNDTCFFVFADTVAARNFQGTNESHGWLGMRFQLRPNTPPNDVLIHIRMLDKTASAQQDALGVIGVNLIYGSFIYSNDYKQFISSLADNLGTERIEIDMILIEGPDFKDIDNRVISLQLVEQGLTNAVLFSTQNKVLQPSEALRKKALMVERGSFRPITHVNLDMLTSAGAQFIQEPKVIGEEVMVLLEITMNNLFASGFDVKDFLARVDIISSLGYNVLISNYPEYYKLIGYFRRYTDKMIGLAMGINHLLAIFNEDYYNNLDGGILESCGRLFKDLVKLYVYPMHVNNYNQYLKLMGENTKGVNILDVIGGDGNQDVLITADNIQVKAHLRHLYAYLKENHFIEAIHGYKSEYLDIFSRDILKDIKSGGTVWEQSVPKKVAGMIKERKLFNYQAEMSREATVPSA